MFGDERRINGRTVLSVIRCLRLAIVWASIGSSKSWERCSTATSRYLRAVVYQPTRIQEEREIYAWNASNICLSLPVASDILVSIALQKRVCRLTSLQEERHRV
jgi:hypothetical protein